MPPSNTKPAISVIVPIRDLADHVVALYEEIRRVLEARGEPFEILLVDDGSSDDTCARLFAFRERDPRLRVLELGGDFGEAAALSAGFDHSTGDVVVTIDGSGRNDPADIPKLLDELQRRGIRVVAGRRDGARDSGMGGLVEALVVRVTGLPIHDPCCPLKAYRRSVLRPIQLPPGMEYFIPTLLGVSASEVAEVSIQERAPKPGRGIGRSFAALRDLLALRSIAHDSLRAQMGFALFTGGAAAAGALLMQTSHLLTAAFDAIAVASGLIWWNARRFNHAQREGVYRIREPGDSR